MVEYQKEGNRLKIIQTIESYTDIDAMQKEINSYQGSINRLRQKINSLNTKIDEAKKLGIKTAKEIERESIIEEPIIEELE